MVYKKPIKTKEAKATRGGGRGTPRKIGWGCAARFPKPLITLFMTKICDFRYPIYDLTKNSKPYL